MTNIQFSKILIANRGEIAVRIISACRDLGIATAIVYTDADQSWLARAHADEAVLIGAGPSAESYIDFDKIIKAAKQTGADAIHPGYGFLAENAAFARRCEEEGIVFIGPSADVIERMGDKAKAKAIVEGLGIPTVPGKDGFGVSDSELESVAAEIGLPLMIKAVAGGGGMGMRIVSDLAVFRESLGAVRREAKASFGDDRVLIERFFPSVRHIEVQVLADAHGNAVHCFERECSVQRRRQKVIEEAPSSFVTPELRSRLCEASLKIVRAVGYLGVGTVEFIVVDAEASLDFYFLEMNTRLQVEHGVTEEATGIDLVCTQIEVAEGKPLSIRQEDVQLQRHAIECRLCAEDPDAGFQPLTGEILHWRCPEGAHVRVDTGIATGARVSVFYDSLLAKIITIGETRGDALRLMRSALGRTQLLGLKTNQHFLKRILADVVFSGGGANTTYIRDNEPSLLAPVEPGLVRDIAIVAAIACARADTALLRAGQGGAFCRTYRFAFEEQELSVVLTKLEGQRYRAVIGQQTHDVRVAGSGMDLILSIDGLEKHYFALSSAGGVHLHNPACGSYSLRKVGFDTEDALSNGDHGYLAAMAGTVTSVLVEVGQQVLEGETLYVLESMKMEHSVIARSDGIVESVFITPGTTVQSGELILAFEEHAEEGGED